jgi:hypothetical protein
LSFAKLKPEEKVELAISMTDVCVRICADGIRDRQPTISELELMKQIRERFEFMKRYEHEEQKCGPLKHYSKT